MPRTRCFSCEGQLSQYGNHRKSYCSRECYNVHRLCVRHGIKPADYHRMMATQQAHCAACDVSLQDGKRPHIDHDHKTGQVRAILCHNCNIALGHLDDNQQRAHQLATYLARHQLDIRTQKFDVQHV